MASKKSIVKYLFPNIMIIFSGIIIAFIIMDFENPTMNFLRDTQNQLLLFIFCIITIINSFWIIINNLKENKEKDVKK